MQKDDVVLICSVGGSTAPILTAVRHKNPLFTTFVCSGGASKNSSLTQIVGEGNCVKAKSTDEKPSLPSIPKQLDMSADRYDTLCVDPDDPGEALSKVRAKLCELRTRFPNIPIIVDYTGGTKSMTAALVLAAVECSDVELQFVVGQRQNLTGVTDGTEVPIRMDINAVRFQTPWKIGISAWKHYGYAQAAQSLESISGLCPRSERVVYMKALALSRGFAAWDRFDHVEALRLLQPFAGEYKDYMSVVALLASRDYSDLREAARLLDMKLNMLRKGECGLYDDAVARGYRLVEWTAQWLLRRDVGIDSSNVPNDRIPSQVRIFADDKGVFKAGLKTSWELLEVLGSPATKDFISQNKKSMLQVMTTRNSSILAHGFEPIEEHHWKSFLNWCDSGFFSLLDKEASASGIKTLPKQLPNLFE